MTARAFLALYLVAGVVAALLMRRRGTPILPALSAILLWPFLLPSVLESDAGLDTRPATPRRRRIDGLERAFSEGLLAGAAADARERRLVEGFLSRLRQGEGRLQELEVTLAAAAPGLKERLRALRDTHADELDRSLALLEELAAQLTLLRFTDLGQPGAARIERDRIEELLAKMEALTQLAAEALRPAEIG